ncbi:hypothetical protein [Planctomicrobium piriforme]|uniref:Uncharacterized protein n=1 Tax=Planctomicrobium piriforme TaxID=1576369 RepID=A0A1I3EGF2_9PLAN|nr:hypothetical protein [Planctomicrobium piriforme]SFH98009.1 hypothetical protein SAMN05421753_104210 [Planctomicrobium piriforme]
MMTDPTASENVQMPWGDAKGVERAVRAAHFVCWNQDSHSYAVLSSVADAVEKSVRHGFTQGQQQADRELVEVLTEARNDLAALGSQKAHHRENGNEQGLKQVCEWIQAIHDRCDAVLARHAKGGGA